jgi:hypothetical protein
VAYRYLNYTVLDSLTVGLNQLKLVMIEDHFDVLIVLLKHHYHYFVQQLFDFEFAVLHQVQLNVIHSLQTFLSSGLKPIASH